jgi:hypothetical protein
MAQQVPQGYVVASPNLPQSPTQINPLQLPELSGWLKKKEQRLRSWEWCFVKLSENKVFMFTSDASGLAPVAHLALTEQVTVQVKNPDKFEFRIFGYYGKEYTFRASHAAELQQWVDTLTRSQEIEKQLQQKIIDIHFLDGYKIPLVVNPKDNTAEDIWWAICEFLELPPESRSCFFIWATNDELDLLLRNEDNVMKIQNDWAAIEDQFHVKIKGMVKFYFKKTITVSLSYERKLKDPRTIHLFYIQALYNVKTGNFVLTEDDIVFLGGLEAQIKLGNYDSTKHANYVTSNLNDWIPKYLQRRRSPNTWQNLIENEHKKHVGKNRIILKLLYLQFVRQKPYYGAILFRGYNNKVKQQGAGFFDHDIEGAIAIGVNMEGIHVFSSQEGKLLRTFSFYDISQWSVDPNDGVFYFKALNRDRAAYEIYLLETPKAPIILDVIMDVVYELNRQRLAIRETRKAQKAESKRELLQRSAITPPPPTATTVSKDNYPLYSTSTSPPNGPMLQSDNAQATSSTVSPNNNTSQTTANLNWDPNANFFKNPLRDTPSNIAVATVSNSSEPYSNPTSNINQKN